IIHRHGRTELTGIPAVFSLSQSSRRGLRCRRGGIGCDGCGRIVMFVETGWLHSGANQSYRAGGHARDGADQLSRVPLSSRMFGEFGAAEVFYEAMKSTHAGHVEKFEGHDQTLTAVVDK